MVGILKRATGTSGLPNQFDTGFHFFIQIGIKPWRGSYVFLEEIKIVSPLPCAFVQNPASSFHSGEKGCRCLPWLSPDRKSPTYILRWTNRGSSMTLL
jgi:hypothetical protein